MKAIFSRLPGFCIAALLLGCGSVVWGYTSGDGSAGSPYEIHTLSDLLELADSPEDYARCFVLTADIDMSAAGSFGRAVIAPDTVDGGYFDGPKFTGVFEGNGHIIRNLVIEPLAGVHYLGLFGQAGDYLVPAEIRDLGVENVTIQGEASHAYIGGLAGMLYEGDVERCYATGLIQLGNDCEFVGGLVGYTSTAGFANCYSMCSVVCGDHAQKIGGLVGRAGAAQFNRNYSAGRVMAGADASDIGGFLGVSESFSSFLANFWDVDASGQSDGVYGTGLRTLDMFRMSPYVAAGWDFVGETTNGVNDYWKSPIRSYPLLRFQDYTIGLRELTLLADSWLTASEDPNVVYPVDWYEDGAVDMKDFAVLGQSWQGGQMHFEFGPLFDGFETGDFSAFDWRHPEGETWQISEAAPYEGRYCAAVDGSGLLELAVTSGMGTIDFYYQITGSGVLYFYIDGVMQGVYSSTGSAWTHAECTVSEGFHEIQWLFFTLNASCAGLDNVRIAGSH